MCSLLRLGRAGGISCIGHAETLARSGLLNHIASLDYTARLRMHQLFHALANGPFDGLVHEWSLQECSWKIFSYQLSDGPMVVSEPYEHVRRTFAGYWPTSVCEVH